MIHGIMGAQVSTIHGKVHGTTLGIIQGIMAMVTAMAIHIMVTMVMDGGLLIIMVGTMAGQVIIL